MFYFFYPLILKKCDNAVAYSWFPSYTSVFLVVSFKTSWTATNNLIQVFELNQILFRGISITQFVVTCLPGEHMLTTGCSCLMKHGTLWCTEKEMSFHFGFFLHFAKCNSISDFQHTVYKIRNGLGSSIIPFHTNAKTIFLKYFHKFTLQYKYLTWPFVLDLSNM